MIVLLTGNDELALQRRLKELQEQADGGSGMLSTNLSVFAGRDAKPLEVVAAATAMPFLSSWRMIVVEELLDRFEARYSTREGGFSDESRAIKPWQPFVDAVAAGLPPTTMLVLTGKAGARNALANALKPLPGVQVESYALPKGGELVKFVRDEAPLHGVRFRNGPSRRVLAPEDEWQRPTETDPAVLLANLHYEDTLGIANELQKLGLYTLGREATVDDVDLLCGGQREQMHYHFTDAILDGNIARAHSALEVLLERGQERIQLFATLLSAYRPLFTVLDMIEAGADDEAIGKAINRPWPTGRQIAIRRAKSYGYERLRHAYETVIAMDRACKLGDIHEEVAMDLLIAQLCTLPREKRA